MIWIALFGWSKLWKPSGECLNWSIDPKQEWWKLVNCSRILFDIGGYADTIMIETLFIDAVSKKHWCNSVVYLIYLRLNFFSVCVVCAWPLNYIAAHYCCTWWAVWPTGQWTMMFCLNDDSVGGTILAAWHASICLFDLLYYAARLSAVTFIRISLHCCL